MPPETAGRETLVEQIDLRPNCHALLTRKRSLENYLHPSAIFAASGLRIEFGDFDPVGELLARRRHESLSGATPWQLLPRRARKRMTYRAKRWLNSLAVRRMTRKELSQRDPHDEVASWLAHIGRLAGLRI